MNKAQIKEACLAHGTLISRLSFILACCGSELQEGSVACINDLGRLTDKGCRNSEGASMESEGTFFDGRQTLWKT